MADRGGDPDGPAKKREDSGTERYRFHGNGMEATIDDVDPSDLMRMWTNNIRADPFKIRTCNFF